MNSNPIDELRNMKVPVSEQEWESIVHDKRYVKKFGKKPGLSPKGRAALIAGAAAVLVSIPILVKTLSHKVTDTAQASPTVTQVIDTQTGENDNSQSAVSPVTQKASEAQHPETTPRMLPSTSSATTNAAGHEQSTLTAVAEARAPIASSSSHTSVPATHASTQPTDNVSTSSEKPANIATTESLTKRHQIVENQPQMANVIPDESKSAPEKSPDDTEADVDEFFIPSAFTPNGDGLNDLYFVQANFVPRTFEMSILNRNGDLVFLTRDMNIGWDGQHHGQTLPSGVYVCIIKYTDRHGNIQKKQGQLLLLP